MEETHVTFSSLDCGLQIGGLSLVILAGWNLMGRCRKEPEVGLGFPVDREPWTCG